MTILHVARFYGLDWKTVKELDRASLERELGPVELTGIEVIGLDEFAIQKGHRYATVIVEPTRKRGLWVGRGRGRADRSDRRARSRSRAGTAAAPAGGPRRSTHRAARS
jgi:transposase